MTDYNLLFPAPHYTEQEIEVLKRRPKMPSPHDFKSIKAFKASMSNFLENRDIQWEKEYFETIMGISPERNTYSSCGCKILVQEAKLPEKTAGGIMILDSARKEWMNATPIGKIIAMGPDVYQMDGEQETPIGYSFAYIGDWVQYTAIERQKVYFSPRDNENFFYVWDNKILARSNNPYLWFKKFGNSGEFDEFFYSPKA